MLRGKDEGNYAVIIGTVDERFVLIADGDKRTLRSAEEEERPASSDCNRVVSHEVDGQHAGNRTCHEREATFCLRIQKGK